MTTTEKDLHAWSRTIQIQERDGVLFATSEEEPTLFVSAFSMDTLYAAVRHALAELFSRVHKREMVCIPTDRGTMACKEMVIVSKEMLAAA